MGSWGDRGGPGKGLAVVGMLPARRVWGWGSRAVELVSDSEKRGRDGRAGEGAGPTPRSRRPYKGPLGPAGGKCGRLQRRRAAGERRAERRPGRRQELSRWAAARGGGRARSAPAAEKLPAWPVAPAAGETYLWPLPPWPRHCPLSLAGAGSPAHRPPAAASCSGNAANGAGALGVGRARGAAGGRRGEGGRGGGGRRGTESLGWAGPQLSCTQPGSPGQRTASK